MRLVHVPVGAVEDSLARVRLQTCAALSGCRASILSKYLAVPCLRREQLICRETSTQSSSVTGMLFHQAVTAMMP